MGVPRAALSGTVIAVLAASVIAVAASGCSSPDPAPIVGTEPSGEPERVPDPPPRYKRVETDSGISLPDESEPTLQIKCGGYQPYVCPLDDGTFRCSDHPCIPDCDRVGCLGGDACVACDGGFRCIAPGDSC